MGTTIHKKIKEFHHVFILYDSILNSVFESQVLRPLQKYASKYPHHRIVIISFEKKHISDAIITSLIPKEFIFIQYKKYPFLGLWSLYNRNLKKLLTSYSAYDIIARGPLAGYLAYTAHTPAASHITIQARGLLAEEYAYVHNNDHMLTKMLHTVKKKLYFWAEKKVYSLQHPRIRFEAVSPALQHYLSATFMTPQSNITLATHDLPTTMSITEKQIWRTKIRAQLSLPEGAYVYCYSGSAHPWQCPQQIITFFASELKKNNNIFLLILSHNNNFFSTLLESYAIPCIYYRVLSVKHEEIYHYLAAANAGLLFREPHIINFVSRPTKALEYQALGLNIIHNNTVAYLCDEAK